MHRVRVVPQGLICHSPFVHHARCVTIPIRHSRELCMHRVRVAAGPVCVTIPIKCHSRELGMHRVRVAAGPVCVTIPVKCHSRELFRRWIRVTSSSLLSDRAWCTEGIVT